MSAELHYLESEEALEGFVARWLDRSLPGAEFTHPAHLACCAWLTFQHRGEALAVRMRHELTIYNVAVGGKNTEDSGYHETLTRLWCALVESAGTGCATPLEAARAAVGRHGEDRNAADRYYSFNVLKSREARKEWVAPDLAALPTTPTPPESTYRHRESAFSH